MAVSVHIFLKAMILFISTTRLSRTFSQSIFFQLTRSLFESLELNWKMWVFCFLKPIENLEVIDFESILGFLSLNIIFSSKLTVFLKLRSRKTVRFSEQIMSAHKYPSIFSPQMELEVLIAFLSSTFHSS